jgi:glutaredoxin 3
VGLYLEKPGITDRATVIIDKKGTVRHISAVGPGGRRDIGDLAALCEGINDGGGTVAEPNAFPASTLYVKSGCGFSLRALNARTNLHLEDAITLKNVTDDADAKAELMSVGGKDQAPCLVTDGKAMYESDDITSHLAQTVYPL